MKKISLFLLLIFLTIFSCAPVYKTENFQEIANTHKSIAVLPPKVIIEIKSATEVQKVRDQEKLESGRFQKALADYINENSASGKFFVKVQNTEETNKILEDKGITSLSGMSYKDLADILGVDAVVSSRVSLAKPLTNAEAFFTSMLTGFGVSSKISTVDLSITDKASGKMFWNFNWQTGGTFVSTEKLTNSLMTAAAKRFPYKTESLANKK